MRLSLQAIPRTWPLTYPFPTITFVTLEDRYDPMTLNPTLISKIQGEILGQIWLDK